MAERPEKSANKLMVYSGAGLEFGLSVVIGLLIGYALDKHFGTAPWLALFWLVCGFIAGARSLYRLAKRLEREAEEEDKDDDAR
jgi:ATP synthase protein I